ncbi:hypothetical protein O181_032938 [Austropuccinia psidii MF-1]|uniref:Uncharacterized protein n=1 Tax=Austropuccinia psidii MF-1 TaxID=1389203 RepID=A0A9Q3H5Z3_9BASI|nr:hypothetical protein [Austropuccinia psidii MF-1]
MHELASISPPNTLKPLACLRARTTLKICLCGHPHHALSSPVLHMLMLLQSPQDIPPMLPVPLLTLPPIRHLPSLRLHSALLTCLQCCPHISLILRAAYHPYAPTAPSQ